MGSGGRLFNFRRKVEAIRSTQRPHEPGKMWTVLASRSEGRFRIPICLYTISGRHMCGMAPTSFATQHAAITARQGTWGPGGA